MRISRIFPLLLQPGQATNLHVIDRIYWFFFWQIEDGSEMKLHNCRQFLPFECEMVILVVPARSIRIGACA